MASALRMLPAACSFSGLTPSTTKPQLSRVSASWAPALGPRGAARCPHAVHTSSRRFSHRLRALEDDNDAPEPFIPASAKRQQPASNNSVPVSQPQPASPPPLMQTEEFQQQRQLQQRQAEALDMMALAEGKAAKAAPLAPVSALTNDDDEEALEPTAVQKFLFPDPEELPDNIQLPVWDHLEELRERVLVALLACGAAIGTCFCFSKELVLFLEAPVADAGVRFLQLSPGEFFFTTLKTAGYAGLLLAAPTVIYQIIAYVVPGLTKSERQFLAPIIFGSSILFYLGILFSYEILTPAALNFFVDYANGAVESLWSIDQYFEFVLVLMLSTGLSFQVPVIQVMLGQTGLVTSDMMLSQWRYVVVGSTVVAAVLTPSTDPFTQALLAIPLVGLYMGGASVVKFLEGRRAAPA